MIAVLIITAAMFAVWLYLCHRLRIPAGITNGFSFDVAGQQWSFLWFFDRYTAIYKWVGWITVGALTVAVSQHNHAATWLLLAALLDNLLFQAVTLFFYERWVHSFYTVRGAHGGAHVGFTYTALKYSAVLTLGIAMPIYFAVGLALTIAGF